MSSFDNLKIRLQKIIPTQKDQSKSIYIPKVDSSRQRIVELIRKLRKVKTSKDKKNILSALTDFEKHPKEIIWKVIHGIGSSVHPGDPDKRYLCDLVWKLNELGAGHYFVQQRCYDMDNAHEILRELNDQGICGVIEGLSHLSKIRYAQPRDNAKRLTPLLISFGPSIIRHLEYYLTSTRKGLSEEVANVICVIKTLMSSNGEKAAKSFISNEVFKCPNSVHIMNRFNDEAIRYLVNNVSLIREKDFQRNFYRDLNPAEDLCLRLIDIHEKSLPILREAAASETKGVAKEASDLIMRIESTRTISQV